MSITDAEVLEALNTVLKPLGTNLRHYMPVHRDEAIEAMRGVLLAERKRAADIARHEGETAKNSVIVPIVADAIAAAILSQAIPQSDAQSSSPARSIAGAEPPPSAPASHSVHRVPSSCDRAAFSEHADASE